MVSLHRIDVRHVVARRFARMEGTKASRARRWRLREAATEGKIRCAIREVETVDEATTRSADAPAARICLPRICRCTAGARCGGARVLHGREALARADAFSAFHATPRSKPRCAALDRTSEGKMRSRDEQSRNRS